MEDIILFRLIFRFVKFMIKIAVLIVVFVFVANIFVIKTTDDKIIASDTGEEGAISDEQIYEMKSIQPECIMVLGASVNPNGTPSPMLRDRLQTGIELYFRGVAPKLLLTGDNGQMDYNEVQVMKNYAVNAGVPEEDIFLDHAGFSTYDSVYRASYVFNVKSMVAVTQKYHLYRTLYGCEKMGIEAVGAGSDQEVYSGQEMREGREILARAKDCIKWIVNPEATFLGEAIPISGNGIATH